MRPSQAPSVHAGRHRSSHLPLWCQVAVQVLGMAMVAAALVVSTVSDPERPIPVQQAELK